MAINLRRPQSKEKKTVAFEIAEKKELITTKSIVTSGIKKISELDVSEKIKNAGVKGLKGGLVGSSAMAANGMIAGATGKAIGVLTATGLGGVVAGTSVGAAIVSAVPVIAGFGAACLVGSAISELVQKEEKSPRE